MNFLLGPRTGDLIHTLYALKCLSDNKPSDIWMQGHRDPNNVINIFSYSLEKTFNDLFPILKKQNYIKNIYLYDEKPSDIIDLTNWISSPLLFRTNWTELLKQMYNLTDKYEKEPWITNIDVNEEYKDKIIIHQSLQRTDVLFDYYFEKIIKDNDNIIFVSSNESEYNNFKFNNLVPFMKVDSLEELFVIINSCKIFIGNQSTPLSIAHSLFKPHLGFLHGYDSIHYEKEEQYNPNFFWINNYNIQKLMNMDFFLSKN